MIPVDATRHLMFAPQLASLISPVSDVFVVLSRRSDFELWSFSSPDPNIRIITLDDWIPEEVIRTSEKNRSVPTFKKWMALARLVDIYDLQDLYSHCICCDCEISVIRPIDDEFVSKISSQFTFVGDHVSRSAWHDNFAAQILKTTLSLDPPRVDTTAPKLPECIDSIFSWWSGLPVYATDSLSEFLNHAGVQNPKKLAESLNCTVFDHLVYQRYVILRRLFGSRVVCLTHDLGIPTGWSLECFATPAVISAVVGAGLEILWVTKSTRIRYPLIAPLAYIENHQDRTPDLE